jgi:Ca2+-binding RTX toxin-like protein
MRDFSMSIEPLEARRLLTAEVILQVIGTDSGDSITVSQTQTSIVVTENGVSQTFQIGQITRVVIDGNGGNDNIDCTTLKTKCSIDGDDGDDTVIGSEKSDRIDGGEGEDSLIGGKGSDNMRGEDDDDIVRGGKGNDTVNGGSGEDNLTGDENDDLLNANDDIFEDTLTGGSGTDTAEVDDELGVSDNIVDTIETVND